jgi:hypothetical protein
VEAESSGIFNDKAPRTTLLREPKRHTRPNVLHPNKVLISDVTRQRLPKANPSPHIVSNPDASKTVLDDKASDSIKKQPATIRRSKLQTATIVLAVVIVIAGGYISFLSIRANHAAQVQVAKLTQQANNAAKSSGYTSVPSTIKPSAAAIANYAVAPSLPRYLMIPKLDVDARVLSVGVNVKGALETPSNVYDTAWYNESAQPGQPGAMLIDGHVSSWTTHGVFYGIKKLVTGDLIKVERGDGTIFTYSVVKSQVFPSGNVNMTSAITPIVAGQPGLNLITCTGDVIPGTSQFNERILVYATLQK